MRKVLVFMGAITALSLATAQAQTVCTNETVLDEEENELCVTTCCVDFAPPEDPAAVDPTAGLCGAIVAPDAAIVAGAINPNGAPPSDPADPTTQTIIEGCISVAGAVSTADAVGEGSCAEQAVAACVANGCSSETVTEGACVDGGDGGGGAPPLPIPGDVPEPPADLPL